MISPENTNLNKIKLKTSIKYKFKSQYILCYNLLAIFFHLYKECVEKNVSNFSNLVFN